MYGYFRTFLICIFFNKVASVPIDNGVKGFPHVTCGIQSVKVDVDTEKSFQGRVYVKGESDKKDCIKSFALANQAPQVQYAPNDIDDSRIITGETVGIELGFGQCSMARQRLLSPRGVEYTFTLVISFHSIFVTKVDKAFRIRCFYMEAEKTLAQQLDVSMLTTHVVEEQYPMPTCRYHLRRGGPGGPPVRFAIVGEPIYHVWECDIEASVIYGMLVKNCFVDDGQGNKVELVNEKGCVNDKHLLSNLLYDKDKLETYTESHVFKYADRPSLFFACTLVLCFKEDGGCNGITPPQCLDGIEYSTPVSYAQRLSKDVPFIPTDTLFPNYTKLEHESEYNFTDKKDELQSWVSLWQHGLKTKNIREKREQKGKRSVIETDIVARPLVVLPFDEYNNERLQLDDIPNFSSEFDEENNETAISNENESGVFWIRRKVSKSNGFCVSTNWFSFCLAAIFLLLTFSASMTILFVRKVAKRVDFKSC